MTDVEESVAHVLQAFGLRPGTGVLTAVSGGADSTALLLALAAQCPTLGLPLEACTIDHGIRDERETVADVEFVAGLCARLRVPHRVIRIERGLLARMAREERRSLEEVARETRRRSLCEAARAAGARWVALGHTRNDLVETLLMRVFQGSDPAGLRGFSTAAGPFIRPLVRVWRTDIVAYLRSRNQAWREDPSNGDQRFLRNAIRHTLVPSLDRSVPGWTKGLLTLSRKAGLADDVLLQLARALPWTPEAGGFSIAEEAFRAAAGAVRARSLLDLYDRLPGRRRSRRLPWRFLAPVLRSALPSGLSLAGHGVRLDVRSGRVYWRDDLASPGQKGYFIVVFEAGTISAGDSGVRVRFARPGGGEAGGLSGTPILEENVRPPLILRSRRRGDALRLAKGATSVKEMFDRWGVAVPERDRVPVLADRTGLVAVLGGALGYATAVRDGALAVGRGQVPRIIVSIERDDEREHERGRRPPRASAGDGAAAGT